ncbi:FtsX-like permease family protein [Streptomyces sp. BE303]|uniref:FtsX-like permease family protein n=1 Tax=Streptomyces sp. BE303 TaxID=3002528 RepID=UPI002E7724AF|nr:FtsX-like permease family protein [Streptomyces sp. BE303]MED7952012.1 hypothetical protein [Streptomyces sp. BE303]
MTSPTGTDGTGRATALPSAAHRPAPWVRTRLRATPLAALLTAALAFGTVFLAAAFPRILDRTADQGLREFLKDRGPAATSLFATSRLSGGAKDLDAAAAQLTAHTGKTFGVAPGGPVYGARSGKPRTLANPGLAMPEGVLPMMDLLYVNGLGDRTTLVEGRWPEVGPQGAPVRIAISKNAADTVGIHLGDVLRTTESVTGQAPQAEVVGFFTAPAPEDPYWTELPCPVHACLAYTTGKFPDAYWRVTGMVAGGALDRVDGWETGAQDFWRLPLDVDRLRADQLPRVQQEIASYLTGPTATALMAATHHPDLRINSQLPQLFTQATARQQAVAPLAALGPAGLAGVGAVVLCLAAALTSDRRTAELRLLQARGGSRGGVTRRLLGEGAVTVLPAAALATALALWLLPTPRWGGAVLAALGVGLFTLLALPVRAALLWSRPRAAGARRRLVGELAVLALTVAAVAEVRRRGVAPVGDGLDPLLVASPLLLALTGGLVLARIQPLLVGALARAAGRRPGVVGFLGLARAARGTDTRPRPSVLPLLALLLAVTTAGFGATVLDAVESARTRAARLTVGGDASVLLPIGVNVTPAFAAAAAALPGVRDAAPVWSDTEVFLLGTGSGSTRISAVVADPVAYAAISRSLGHGAFDPAVLAGGSEGPDAPLPALVSTALAEKLAGDATGHRLRLPGGGELLVGAVGTVDGTPALQGDGRMFVVLPAAPAVARAPELGRPNLWFAAGSVDEAELKRLVRELIAATATKGRVTGSTAEKDALPAGYTVRTGAGVVAELGDDPLQESAERLFWVAVLGAGVLALLAVLLTLVRAAPERAALLARLRTMGLRPRQGLFLILVETLPQTLVAAVGGGLVAVAAVALLGPAFDLSTLVGAAIPAGLPVAVPPVLLQTVGLAALVSAGVVAEALVSGRRQIATELRAGDQQ